MEAPPAAHTLPQPNCPFRPEPRCGGNHGSEGVKMGSPPGATNALPSEGLLARFPSRAIQGMEVMAGGVKIESPYLPLPPRSPPLQPNCRFGVWGGANLPLLPFDSPFAQPPTWLCIQHPAHRRSPLTACLLTYLLTHLALHLALTVNYPCSKFMVLRCPIKKWWH